MTGGARATAAAEAKTRQLEDAWSSHIATETRQEHLADLAAIVAELQRCPEKLKSARKAVLSNMFIPKPQTPHNPDGSTIPDCDKWCFKLPKHFFDSHAPDIFELTDAQIRLMVKFDRQSLHKLLCSRTGWHANTRVTVFVKDSIAQKISEQIALVGAKVGEHIQVEANGAIDWPEVSPYTLLPPCPSEVEPDEHRYTKVCVFGRFETNLPKWLTITGAWKWHNAWSLQDCVVKLDLPVQAGAKKRASPTCHFYNECFINHKEFQKWFTKLPSTLGDATATAASDSQGAADGSKGAPPEGGAGSAVETPVKDKKRPRAPAMLGLASVRKQIKKMS